MDPAQLTDSQLVVAAQQPDGHRADDCLEELFSRYQSKVAYWCLRISGDRERAADLAQEVFLRVHDKLHTFRREARFSTWLYTVTRSVTINSGIAARRRRADSLDADEADEPVDPAPAADERVDRRQRAAWLRRAMAEDLDPVEAKVLYLHFVDGLTLPGITELLGLTNKSGAKAFIVSGKRKLRRRVASGGSF